MRVITTQFRPAKECNLWTMTDVEILGLQRGQWVYCCQPREMDTARPSRYFGTKKSGTIWAAHWQGSKQNYKQFQSWCETPSLPLPSTSLLKARFPKDFL